MSLSKISLDAGAGVIAQQANALQFNNHFAALESSIAAGDSKGAQNAMSDYLRSYALSTLSGFSPMPHSLGMKESLDALKYQVRAGNMDGAKAVLESLRQTFNSPSNSVAGTDLHEMRTASGTVAGTDLRAIKMGVGAVAGTDLRNVTVASAAGSGIDLRAMQMGRSGAVAGTDLRELTVASSVGSPSDLRAIQMGSGGSVAGTDLRELTVASSAGSPVDLRSIKQLSSGTVAGTDLRQN